VCDAPCAVGYGGPVQETRLRKSVFLAFGKRDSIGLKYSEMDVQGNYDLRESWSRRRAHVSVGFLGLRGKRCAMGDLNPAFHALLKRVQDRWPNVIPANVDVEAEYDIARSERRGVTAHAQNQCIPKE